MLLLWKKPNNEIAKTKAAISIDNVLSFANVLKDEGIIPADWELLEQNTSWPADERWDLTSYRWDGNQIMVDIDAARQEIKERLRSERKPLLEQLDIDYIRALEQNLDVSIIVSEKQRLRDITATVDTISNLDDLFNLHC